MVTVSYNELHELIDKGIRAKIYAWEHYEELAAREAAYTLFGPRSLFLGAASPSHHTYANERKLQKKTRREKYTKYELDESHRVIRVTQVYDHDKVYSVYHLFEIDGVTYACAFRENKRQFADYRVEAFKIQDGKALYYAQTAQTNIFCEFYEYPGADKRLCTEYLYSKNCQKTVYRLTPDWDAPFGAPNSPVSVYCCEDNFINVLGIQEV